MIHAAASLLIPLALTAGIEVESPSFHHPVRAHVTGYNTVPAQTDSTPCIAASGADICGRRDAVACPRRIKLGTVVEIRGTTYVCEDRLAKKYDARFDISCDKDKECPYQVAGWTTIKVYADERPAPPIPAAKPADTVVRQAAAKPAGTVLRRVAAKAAKSAHAERRPLLARVKALGRAAVKVATDVSVLRGHSG
jgi:hypothetical protein